MYYAGDYKVICEQCGMTYLRSECQTDWEGRIVCSRGCFEERHPQDFVRGVPDITRVADPRPDVSYDAGETTLSASASALADTLSFTSVSSLSRYDAVGIVLDTGIVHWTFLLYTPAARTTSTDDERTTSQGDTRTVSQSTTVEIYDPLPSAAASGNTVYLPSVSGVTFLGVTEVSEDDF